MAPASVFDKAHRQLSCHAGASIIITDAWEISPMQYECLALVTDAENEHNGHFVAMISIDLDYAALPDIHLGAETTEQLQQIYDVVTYQYNPNSTEEES